MTKPKKQHYVPQFLLRNFSRGARKRAKLWVLDKGTQRVYQASARNVGHENFFYEYHGEAGDLELEELMQKIDSKAAPLIASIIKNGRLPSSEKDRVWLSYVVATQMMRTPMIRKEMENLRQLLIHKWGDMIRAHPDDKTIGEYGPDDARASSLHILADVPEFAKLLQEKAWTICEAPPAMLYVISDCPVVKHNMIDRWPRGNLGLKNEGIELYVPLSPKFAIHAICPKLAAAALVTPELAVPYSHALDNDAPFRHAPLNAEFVNSLQVIWSERYVYARDRQHLEMPLDMLRTNPELRDGPGVRQKPEDG